MTRSNKQADHLATRRRISGLAIVILVIFVGCDQSYRSDSPVGDRIGSGEVLEPVTDDEFSREVLGHDAPVVVVMTTKWCPECKEAKPVLVKLSKKLRDRVRFREVDAETNPFVMEKYDITQFPSTSVFVKGDEVKRFLGTQELSTLEQWLSHNIEPGLQSRDLQGE